MNKITLKDVLPWEATAGEYEGERFLKYLDEEVIKERDSGNRWPGSHKNISKWWTLANGLAVGWNENLARGWSFPVKRIFKV